MNNLQGSMDYSWIIHRYVCFVYPWKICEALCVFFAVASGGYAPPKERFFLVMNASTNKTS